MSNELENSPRFQRPVERRDFLGLMAAWSAGLAVLAAMIGAFRLPMPSAFPEANESVKLGVPKDFQGVTVTAFPEHRLWVFSDDEGLFAISSVCTHLGCIVSKQTEGGFQCPCHGSRFDNDGRNVSGPAPRPLEHLELFLAPDGQLVVNRKKQVAIDFRFKV